MCHDGWGPLLFSISVCHWCPQGWSLPFAMIQGILYSWSNLQGCFCNIIKLVSHTLPYHWSLTSLSFSIIGTAPSLCQMYVQFSHGQIKSAQESSKAFSFPLHGGPVHVSLSQDDICSIYGYQMQSSLIHFSLRYTCIPWGIQASFYHRGCLWLVSTWTILHLLSSGYHPVVSEMALVFEVTMDCRSFSKLWFLHLWWADKMC